MEEYSSALIMMNLWAIYGNLGTSQESTKPSCRGTHFGRGSTETQKRKKKSFISVISVRR